ncbi:endonuclease domain-containing protein, partial [Arthrobacter sp. H41]|uniref:endonuclease domain-containing protein n=1 Tax=Arthrobacter sp. H41 TaxID=1312978 RepID=UPI000676115A
MLARVDAPADFAAAYRVDARLTCVSAAAHYGLWVLEPAESLHLSSTHGRNPASINHRQRTVAVHPVLPLVGLIDVLLHSLQCLPLRESVVIIESAFRRGACGHQLLLNRLPGRRNGKARSALARVATSADSAIEVVARLVLEDAGWQVEPQVHLPGVGRVDFLLEGFLVVEIDGAAFHPDRKALRRDRQRNKATVIGGYLVLRFCYEDVMFFPDELLAQVAQV